MSTYKELEELILKFKKAKQEHPDLTKRSFNEYHIFKRFTTSKRDHEPQQRLAYNVRRAWPITAINPGRYLPKRFEGVQLIKGERDLGEKERQLVSISAPDYLSHRGESVSEDTVNALLCFENEKIARFLAQDYPTINYGLYFPHRTEVTVTPVIGALDRSAISSTLVEALLPNYRTPNIMCKADKRTAESLRAKITPLLNLKTTMAIVQASRNLITPHRKWLPTTVHHSPETAELSHFACGPYHLVPIQSGENADLISLEVLCYQVIRTSLLEEIPKDSLLQHLGEVTVDGLELTQVLSNKDARYPHIQLCQCALDNKMKLSKFVRETKIVTLHSEGKPITVTKRFGVGTLLYDYSYTYRQGASRYWFQNGGITGVFTTGDNALDTIWIRGEGSAVDVILDICWYSKTTEVGFDIDFPDYVPKDGRMNYYYQFWRSNWQTLISTLGVTNNKKKGVVNIQGEITTFKGPWIERILPLKENIHPYDTITQYRMDVDLKIYELMQGSWELVMDPRELRPPTGRLPPGVKVSNMNLCCIYLDNLSRLRSIIIGMFHEPQTLLQLRDQIIFDLTSPIKDLIPRLFNIIPSGPNYKNILEEKRYNLEDLQNVKKIWELMFFCFCALTPTNNKRKRKGTPTELSLAGSGSILTKEADKGLLRIDTSGVKILNQTIMLSSNVFNERYSSVGVFTKQPEGVYVTTMDQAMSVATPYERFCVHVGGEWYVYEERKTKYRLSQNIIRSYKNLKRKTQTLSLIESKIRKKKE